MNHQWTNYGWTWTIFLLSKELITTDEPTTASFLKEQFTSDELKDPIVEVLTVKIETQHNDIMAPMNDTEKENLTKEVPTNDVEIVLIVNQQDEDVRKDLLMKKKHYVGYTRLDQLEKTMISMYLNYWMDQLE